MIETRRRYVNRKVRQFFIRLAILVVGMILVLAIVFGFGLYYS